MKVPLDDFPSLKKLLQDNYHTLSEYFLLWEDVNMKSFAFLSIPKEFIGIVCKISFTGRQKNSSLFNIFYYKDPSGRYSCFSFDILWYNFSRGSIIIDYRNNIIGSINKYIEIDKRSSKLKKI